MAQISLTIPISAQQFYNYLLESLIADINKSVKQKVNKQTLKSGYVYRKAVVSGAKRAELVLTIEELVKNRIYHLSYQSSSAANDIQYLIRAVDEDSCDVTYIEEVESFRFLDKFILSFTKPFKMSKWEKKVAKNLQEISNQIANKK